MELPKTTKGYLKLLLLIAEDNNAYKLKNATQHSGELISNIRANIQNELGDDINNVLEENNLKWNG